MQCTMGIPIFLNIHHHGYISYVDQQAIFKFDKMGSNKALEVGTVENTAPY